MSYRTAPSYTVVRDTREQQGYFFNKFGLCKGTIQKKLDTGDYSILGLEDKLCIERKASVEELAVNLGQKKYAFFDEIERMRTFPHRYLVLEFSLYDLMDFPNSSNISEENKSKIKVTGKYMLRCLMEFQVYNDVHVLFCGNSIEAKRLIGSLFKRINEKYTIGRTS